MVYDIQRERAELKFFNQDGNRFAAPTASWYHHIHSVADEKLSYHSCNVVIEARRVDGEGPSGW